MNKFCDKCSYELAMDIFTCPKCSSGVFVHRDPNQPFPISPTEELPRTSGTLRSLSTARETSPQTREASPKPREIAPEKLKKFKARFAKELENLEYLEWRSVQPNWKNDNVQQRMKSIQTTAAGVFLGTSVLRAEVNNIQDMNLADSNEGSSDLLGDLFN